MTIQLVSYHGFSEHQLQRTESLRLAGQKVSQSELRARVAQDADIAQRRVNNAYTLSSATVSPLQASTNEPVLQDIVDATTRLRALILSSLMDQPAKSTIIWRGALSAEQTTFNADEIFGSDLALTDEKNVLLSDLSRNAILITDEREVSSLSMSVEMVIGNDRVLGELFIQQGRHHYMEVDASAQQLQKFLDPLVLNFSGPVQLAKGSTLFDLNADGKLETLPNLISDSYLLVRDLNGNGKVDDGSEVIGALSGNGYAELRALDDNNDSFISAEDKVFQRLTLWRPGQEGLGLSLDAKAVQAIYLNAIESPFGLQQRESGGLLGQVRQSSFFVADSQLKLSQQVDFLV